MKKTTVVLGLALASLVHADSTWVIENQADWDKYTGSKTDLEIKDGQATPTAETAVFQSAIKSFSEKQSAASIRLSQSPVWLNWNPVKNIGPKNLKDAPVFLRRGENDYWMFGRYGGKPKGFQAQDVTLDGFDVSLKTTPWKNQYDAPGGLQKGLGGYHAWQSRDMVNWIHHGSVTHKKGKWMTTAEYVDGKAYFYYDFPNDQNPHLFIDDDLTDGKLGKEMGMAFNDPSDGSDCAFIRDLDGNFHVIAEDWSPINASKHAWDSPLATHAVSADGIGGFKILDPAVDERTEPSGKFAEYLHPHWHKEDPENYPAKVYDGEKTYHGIKPGQKAAFARYEIHEPAQNAFGDWASISIGGQYYLFCDFDPSTAHGDKKAMSVAWFTSPDINEQFTFCGNLGSGHPDPDVIFAEGQFYLATQMSTDYVSSGPWVEGVEVRVGVDVSNDGKIDEWTDWQTASERYEAIQGFAKQVATIPAELDLSTLPAGYGFQFEMKLSDQTENDSRPIIDQVQLQFKP
ncbi:hypothetical protein P4B35_12185 [Pontiellaceae bacterium B12227]|nr:hypothetical protein [Pontiellaceae bacterium B12227]